MTPKVRNDSLQMAGPPLDDDDSWEWLCFQYYQQLETLRAYNNLVVNEVTFITAESQQYHRTTSPFAAVLSSVVLELDRHGKESKVERAMAATAFFRYRDLRDQGAWLLSEGVPILELVTLLGHGEGHHSWFFERDMSRLASREHLTGLLASSADDRSHASIKRLKQRIRGLLNVMSDKSDVELVKLLRSGQLEFLFGIMGTSVALDILMQHGPRTKFHKRLSKARGDYKSSMEELSFQVVQLFKNYSIKPCYTSALLMANGLLGRPYFLPDKDPVSGKSSGQDKLRKLYDRLLRKRAR